MNETPKKFEGFFTPNSTQVPDNFFDELLADLSGNETKVVCYIMRRTFGFKKQNDDISINQMLNGITKRDGTILDRGVGLSKPTLLRALISLAEQNVIVPTRRYDEKGGNLATNYRLNIAGGDLGKRMSQGGYQNVTEGVVKERDKPLVKERYPQVTVIQDTENTVNVKGEQIKEDKTDLRKLPDIEQPREKTQYVAEEIYSQLKDPQSKGFYYLVAAKVSEGVIWQALAEIKAGGAHSPAKVFTSRIKTYATEKLAIKRGQNLYADITLLTKEKAFH